MHGHSYGYCDGFYRLTSEFHMEKPIYAKLDMTRYLALTAEEGQIIGDDWACYNAVYWPLPCNGGWFVKSKNESILSRLSTHV